jgi:Asp/Glu/Hydantoin racemase
LDGHLDDSGRQVAGYIDEWKYREFCSTRRSSGADGSVGAFVSVILHEIILAELVNGVFTDRARHEYARIIDRLAARGCDAVGLVCTEIPLLVPPDAAPLPVLDSTRLLARAAFDAANGQRAMPTWRGGPVAD